MWNEGSDAEAIPVTHQARFVEALKELPLDSMCKVMAKEIREMQAGTA